MALNQNTVLTHYTDRDGSICTIKESLVGDAAHQHLIIVLREESPGQRGYTLVAAL